MERETFTPVGGRLSLFLDTWAEITEDCWVLQTVSGYQLPFHTLPESNLNPAPHIIKPDQEDLIHAEIERLIANKAIEETSDLFYLNQIFLVPKPHGGWRPVVNLKPLNKYLVVEHFKMENLNMVTDSIQQGWWMAKLDLKDAYLTVKVSEQDKKYLQFEWKGKYYQFRSLPFGLATAPFVFTKLTKPVVAHLRVRGMSVIIYIDDILILAPSEAMARECVEFTAGLFTRLGFLINVERSIMNPVQIIEFLGFEINSIQLTWSIPKHKKEKIKISAETLLQEIPITARHLARVLGLITSAVRGYQPATLHIRQAQMCLIENLKNFKSWDQQLVLSDQALQEIHWWIQNVLSLPGSPIFNEPHELVIETDASSQGWGARCGHLTTGGVWSHAEKSENSHINPLELLAAFLAIQCFCKNRNGITVLIKTDNKSALAYINKLGGTKSRKLNKVAIQMWDWCLSREIWVKAEHLPGKLNLWADWESRNAQDPSDWKLRPDLVKLLFLHHQCDVDLFASRLNHQLPAYWSWKPDPKAQGTNSFLLDWKLCRGYAFPPFCLVGRCVQQCIRQKAKLLLVAPFWKNQFWYPLLLNSLYSLPILIPSVPDLLTNPENLLHPLCQQSTFYLVAWPISGNLVEVDNFQKELYQSWGTPLDQVPRLHTSQHGHPTFAGVLQRVWIPFKSLFQTS